MTVAKCLDDSVCWVCEFVCFLNNAQGIHYVLLVQRINKLIKGIIFLSQP